MTPTLPIAASISDDGTKIAYVLSMGYDVGHRFDLYIAEKINGNWQSRFLFTRRFQSVRSFIIPYLTGDGNYIVLYQSSDSIAEIIDSQTGDVVYTLYNVSYSCCKVLGTKLLYEKRFWGESTLKLVDIPSGNITTITPPEGFEYLNDYYVSSNGKVVFSMVDRGVSNLFYFDGARSHLIKSGLPLIFSFAISGDGTKVFYNNGNYLSQGHGIIWMMTLPDRNEEEILSAPESKYVVVEYADHSGNAVAGVIVMKNGDSGIYILSTSESTHGFVAPKFNSVDLRLAIPSQPTLIVGSSASSYGSEIQIPVTIKNADNIGSIDLEISYPSVLKPVEVLPGSLTQDSLLEYNIQNGRIIAGMVDTSGISGDGSLLYMNFVVTGKPSESGGKMRSPMFEIWRLREFYTLQLMDAAATDVDGNRIEMALINGTFRLISEEEAIRGDVNGDGGINSLDALLALQMAVGKLKTSMVADMDGDGAVKASDALEIMKIASSRILKHHHLTIGES